jgi:hypothetical protein
MRIFSLTIMFVMAADMFTTKFTLRYYVLLFLYVKDKEKEMVNMVNGGILSMDPVI